MALGQALDKESVRSPSTGSGVHDASVLNAALLRGVDNVCLHNAVRFAQACYESNPQPFNKIADNIIAELDGDELKALIVQAKSHPKLQQHMTELVGPEDDEEIPKVEDFGADDDAMMEELSAFIAWLAEQKQAGEENANQPMLSQKCESESDSDCAGSDSDTCEYNVDADTDFPAKDQPWHFLRSYAEVSWLMRVWLGYFHIRQTSGMIWFLMLGYGYDMIWFESIRLMVTAQQNIINPIQLQLPLNACLTRKIMIDDR